MEKCGMPTTVKKICEKTIDKCNRHKKWRDMVLEENEELRYCSKYNHIYKCNKSYPKKLCEPHCIKARDYERNKKATKIQCAAIKNDGRQCTLNAKQNKKYCGGHLKKYGDKEPDLSVEKKLCKGCRDTLELDQFKDEYKTCIKCNNRKNYIKCKHCNLVKELNKDRLCKDCMNIRHKCNFRINGINQCSIMIYHEKNKFCGKHYDIVKEARQMIKDGVKKCRIHGCHNKIPRDAKYTACEPCRINERVKDNKRHKNKKKQKAKITKELDDGYKICRNKNCNKIYLKYEIDNVYPNLCIICYDKYREVENKRDRSNRNHKTYNDYIRKSKTRKIKFELSEDEFNNVMKQNCFYCNSDSSIGIDRIDGYKGYIKSNVLSCCSMCNYIKCCADPETFYKRVKHLCSKKKLINNTEYSDNLFNYKGVLKSHRKYYRYTADANKRGKKMNLNRDLFDELLFRNCFYCDSKPHDGIGGGIDRIDSNKNYDENNVVACCSICNFMKKDYDTKEYYKKLRQIANYCNMDKIKQLKYRRNYKVVGY